MIPMQHQKFMDQAVSRLRSDPRIVAVLGAGSLITGTMDEYSDIDLIAVSSPESYQAVSAERVSILRTLGDLVSYFSGEHVGEPRLMICLYSQPLLHVDVKFVSLDDLKQRVENPLILFERQGCVSSLFQTTQAQHPMPDPQWIEDRFWTWIHYAALRLGRGELFEVLDMLGFLRGQVFGPLALVRHGQLPRGVRRIEKHCPDYISDFNATVALHEKKSCSAAIAGAIKLYRKMRAKSDADLRINSRAEAEAVRFFETIAQTTI